MRGSAPRISGRAENPCARRGLAGDFIPVHPRPKRAWLPCGNPAPERFASRTSDRRVRPLGTRAQGALLPETPARNVGFIPLPPLPLRRCML